MRMLLMLLMILMICSYNHSELIHSAKTIGYSPATGKYFIENANSQIIRLHVGAMHILSTCSISLAKPSAKMRQSCESEISF